MKINELTKAVHENAINHGWWEEQRSFGDIIALCHSELSEALKVRQKAELKYFGEFAPIRRSQYEQVCSNRESR